jgi:hypothetical protein
VIVMFQQRKPIQNSSAHPLSVSTGLLAIAAGLDARAGHPICTMADSPKNTRWDVARLGITPAPRPRRARWRSRDLKGPLPVRVVRALELAIKSLPSRGPWPEIDEEAWWADVLADWRARPPAPKTLSEKHAQAALRLDRLPTKSLTFACARCMRSITVTVADLCARFGTDRNVKTIGQDVLTCKDKAWRRDGGECPVSYRA